MTKDEALKMAIDEIQDLIHHIKARQPNMLFSSSEYVIESCKEALEQPAQEQSAFMDEVKYGQSFMLDEKHVPLETVYKQSAQEPVGWIVFDYYGNGDYVPNDNNKFFTKQTSATRKPIPVYTHPHPTQPLSDDAVNELWLKLPQFPSHIDVVRAIELAHGIGVNND
jgi:hypothetical protein